MASQIRIHSEEPICQKFFKCSTSDSITRVSSFGSTSLFLLEYLIDIVFCYSIFVDFGTVRVFNAVATDNAVVCIQIRGLNIKKSYTFTKINSMLIYHNNDYEQLRCVNYVL